GTGQFQFAPPTLDEAQAHSYTSEEKAVKEKNKGRFVIGSPQSVKEQLEQLVADTLVDEVMVLNMITDTKARHSAYTLLADAFHLHPSSDIPGKGGKQ